MGHILTLQSVRNYSVIPELVDNFVYESVCAIYDLPRDVAQKLGLLACLSHPKAFTQYVKLYFMVSCDIWLVKVIR